MEVLILSLLLFSKESNKLVCQLLFSHWFIDLHGRMLAVGCGWATAVCACNSEAAVGWFLSEQTLQYVLWHTVHWPILLVPLDCFGIQVCLLQLLFLCMPWSPLCLCPVTKVIPTSAGQEETGACWKHRAKLSWERCTRLDGALQSGYSMWKHVHVFLFFILLANFHSFENCVS